MMFLALKSWFLLKILSSSKKILLVNIHEKEVLTYLWITKLWNSPAQDVVKARGINALKKKKMQFIEDEFVSNY